jgi:LysM repeat protein
VVLSPKNHTVAETTGLSQDGLKPIMANSVMPTIQQNVELLANKNKANLQVNERIVQQKAPKMMQKIADDFDNEDDATVVIVGKNVQIKQKNNQSSVPIPIHTVEKGDSLFAISVHYNIVMKNLERWNKLRSPYLLSIGDEIYLADPKSAAKREE